MKTVKKISVVLLAFVLMFAMLFTLAACNNDEGDNNNEIPPAVEGDKDTGTKKSFSVIVPDGAPLAAITQMRHDVKGINGNKMNYYVELESNLSPVMTKSEADFIIAPTNLGANIHNNLANYKLAASVTWGMLYFVTTDSNLKAYNANNLAASFLTQFSDKTIRTIGATAIPGKSLQYILDAKGVNATVGGDEAKNIVADIELNKNVIGVIAEPILSTIESNPNCHVLGSVSDIYTEITGKAFPMASLFIKSSVITDYETTVGLFLENLSDSIDFVSSDVASNAATVAAWAAEFGDSSAIKAETFATAAPRMNIAYKNASDSKEDVKTLLTNVGMANVPDSLFM